MGDPGALVRIGEIVRQRWPEAWERIAAQLCGAGWASVPRGDESGLASFAVLVEEWYSGLLTFCRGPERNPLTAGAKAAGP